MFRPCLRPLARLSLSTPAPLPLSLPIRPFSLVASPVPSTSAYRLPIKPSPTRHHRRTIVLHAEPPAEEPEEPLEGEAVIDVTEPAIAVRQSSYGSVGTGGAW